MGDSFDQHGHPVEPVYSYTLTNPADPSHIVRVFFEPHSTLLADSVNTGKPATVQGVWAQVPGPSEPGSINAMAGSVSFDRPAADSCPVP